MRVLTADGISLLHVTLFFMTGVQCARLYIYGRAGHLRHMAFWDDGQGGVSYFAGTVAAVALWALYDLVCRAVPPPDADGPSAGDGLLHRMIMRLKARERELHHHHQQEKGRAEQQEHLNEAIIDSLESALVTINSGGGVVVFNPAAERLFRRAAGPVRGAPYEAAFGRSPQLVALIRDCLAHGVSYRRQEFRITDEEGGERYVGAALAPLRQPDGTACGALCLITDLTEIIDLQQRVQLRESLAALGEMSAGIAHEFKNALYTITGYAQLAARGGLPAEAGEYVREIHAEAQALAQVVTNFLAFARPQPLAPEEFDLDELVGQAVRDLEADATFGHVSWEVSGPFGRVHGDRLLLKQALHNLLRNAAEAIAPDSAEGRVRVEGRTAGRRPHRRCIVTIEDTGVGISEGQWEKIFLPFFTTKPTGTGLGLATAQKTVVLHNGKISVARRTPAPGTRFTVELPAT